MHGEEIIYRFYGSIGRKVRDGGRAMEGEN